MIVKELRYGDVLLDHRAPLTPFETAVIMGRIVSTYRGCEMDETAGQLGTTLRDLFLEMGVPPALIEKHQEATNLIITSSYWQFRYGGVRA